MTHFLLISPYDLSINVILNASIINVRFATVFLIQSFHANKFFGLANRYLVGFILLLLKFPINFSLDLLGTGLFYLLDIMMNSSYACATFGLSPGFKLNGNS